MAVTTEHGILLFTEAGDVSVNGSSAAFDTKGRKRISWAAVVTNLAGASPGVTFSWEHSPDGVTWFTVATEAALITNGNKTRVVTTENLFRFLRVSWTEDNNSAGDVAISIEAK